MVGVSQDSALLVDGKDSVEELANERVSGILHAYLTVFTHVTVDTDTPSRGGGARLALFLLRDDKIYFSVQLCMCAEYGIYALGSMGGSSS